MITTLVSRLIILGFGTLYPAYASFKAIRNKDVNEYVKWMMYWIVFALFSCVETFTDVMLSFWLPFYYEIKVALVFWLLSPTTKGSSFLYRNFVHPTFLKKEDEIDGMIVKAKERGYNTVLSLSSKSIQFAANVIIQTAVNTIQEPNGSVLLTDEAPMNQGVPDTTTMDAGENDTRDPYDISEQLEDELQESIDTLTPTFRRSSRLRTQNP